MSTILSNIAKRTTDINDEVIAGSMMGAAKSAADAYLNATMTSTTPELRALYSASLTQVVGGHSTLTELSVNKGWISPYDTPSQQLSEAADRSETTV